MVPLSIMGMTGGVNLFFLAVWRPGTLSIARRRSTGAFFCGKSGSFDLWGLRRGGGGSRWSDAACDAPGRHPRYTQDRTLWLQEPWVRREQCTLRPSTRWQTSWRCRSDHLLRICRGQDRQSRGGDAAAAAPGATARGVVRAAMWRSYEREEWTVAPVSNRPDGTPPSHGGPP
jgi:hypothetical protein